MSGLDGQPCGQLPTLLFESTLHEEIDFLSLSLTEATNASESILPAELYIRIMENLDGKSLLTCMLISRLFRDLIARTASLQYVIELAVSNQRDEPLCDMSSAQKLENLRRHQTSWIELKRSREYRIDMADGSAWELCGGVLAQSMADGTLVCHQLPSDLRSIEENCWSIGPFMGIPIRDFGMDPSEDILVLIEDVTSAGTIPPNNAHIHHRLHLRSLSTGKVHHLALGCPVLELPHLQDIDPDHDYIIRVSGNITVLLISGDQAQIAIWDWKTNTLLCNIRDSEDVEIMAFSLLSDKWVLLGIKDEKDTPCLAVWDFRQGNKDLQELDVSKTLVILKYPTYAGSPRFYSMDIRTNPSPLRKDKPSNSQCPFYHDPDNFVLVVTVTSFLHCIPAAHLLSLVASAQSEKTATYEWGSWINRQTCLFIPLNPPSDEWVCYVYGTKFVFADWARHRDESSCLLRLFDFNPLARRDGDQTNNLPPPGLISKQEIVKRLLSGASLPYRSYALYLEDTHDHCQAMISEDNIILVDSPCREFRILVF